MYYKKKSKFLIEFGGKYLVKYFRGGNSQEI